MVKLLTAEERLAALALLEGWQESEGGKALPIAQSFRNIEPVDRLASGQIGQGAGHAQHAMKAARGQVHGIGGFAQKLSRKSPVRSAGRILGAIPPPTYSPRVVTARSARLPHSAP